MAFAFEQDAAVVDTNIARVYARVAGERLTPKRVQAMADDALPDRRVVGVEPVPHGPRRRAVPTAGPWMLGVPDPVDVLVAGGDAPDPAVGSSGVSGTQARFDGSDRQARGRLMKALSDGPVAVVGCRRRHARSEAAVASRLVGRPDRARDSADQDRSTIRLPH